MFIVQATCNTQGIAKIASYILEEVPSFALPLITKCRKVNQTNLQIIDLGIFSGPAACAVNILRL
jgi:hypothetical protein